MKIMLFTGLLILLYVRSISQNLDLVVTSSGDSVVCKIDSIIESTIYLQIKTEGNDEWVQTIYDIKNINKYEYNCIEPSEYTLTDGTSEITGKTQPVYPKKYPGKLQLENAPQDELSFYLEKAKKTKKTGTKMSIAGPVTAAAGLLLAVTNFTLSEDDAGFVFGSLLLLTGFGITLVGIPILITGSTRVNTINKIKNSRDLTMELVPYSFNNYQAQNHQQGVTLRIRF